MRRLFLFSLVWLTLLSACALPPLPLPPRPQSNPPPTPAGENVLALTYGEKAMTANGNLNITFAALLEDSRCPADVSCAWSGWVRIQLLAQRTEGETEPPLVTLEITAFTNGKGIVDAVSGPNMPQPYADVDDYRLTLLQVTPYPARYNQLPSTREYQIWLAVDRAPASDDANPTAPQPATPTPTPLAATACPNAPRLPVLCFSYRAITEYAAGQRQEPPMLLTAPLATCQLPSQAAGDASCQAEFGEDWAMADAEKSQIYSTWYDFLPTDTAYWLWDENANELVAQE